MRPPALLPIALASFFSFSPIAFHSTLRAEQPPGPVKPDDPKAEEAKRKKKKDPVKFQAQLGFDDSGMRAWTGRWNPLHLAIENLGEEGFEGTVVVEKTRSNENLPGTTYARRVSMPAGARKRLDVPVFIEDNDQRLDVQLHAGGYGTRQIFISPIPYRPFEAFVVVCADEAAGTVNALARQEERIGEDGDVLQRYRCLLPPDRLPETWAGYGDAMAVVLETGDFASIAPAQIDALREYVHAGGTLVVSAGRHAAAFQNGPLADFLPVTITGSEVAEPLDLRGRIGGRIYEGKFTLAKTEPLPQIPLGGNRKTPLVVDEPRGAGRVVFLAFSLSEFSRAIRGKEDREVVNRILARAPSVFRPPGAQVENSSLLSIPNAAPMRDQRTRSNFSSSPWAFPENGEPSNVGLRNQIDTIMRQGLVVRFPPVHRIATLIGVYFVLLVPINYLAWRRTLRLEFAWATAVVLAVVFGGAYGAWGYLSGGNVLTGETLTIVETRSGSPVGRYVSFHSLYSPGPSNGDVWLAGAETGFARQEPLLSRLRVSETSQGIRALDYFVRWDEPRCVFEGFQIYPRAVRTFEAEGTCSLGEGLAAVADSDRKAYTITNRTPWALTRVDQDGQLPLMRETLAPGGSVRVPTESAGSGGAGPSLTQRWAGTLAPYLFHFSFPSRGRYVVAYAEAETLRPVVKGRSVSLRHTLVIVVPIE